MEDARRRGEPLAALLASESTIYRRFGYGVAVLNNSSVEIDQPYARLRRPIDVPGGLRMLDRDEMPVALPPVHDCYRRQQPGDATLVVDVADRFCPEVSGRYRLVGGARRPAECRRTDDPAELALEGADLASAYLGAVSFATLAPGRARAGAGGRRAGPGRRVVRHGDPARLLHRLLRFGRPAA